MATGTLNKLAYEDRQPPAVLTDQQVEQYRESAMALTTADFYDVGGGKKAPSARAWNKWALEQRIQIRVMDAGYLGDPEYPSGVWVLVRGWMGKEEHPGIIREARVTLHFSYEYERLVWEAIDSKRYPAPVKKDADGNILWDPRYKVPLLADARDQLRIIKQLQRIRSFADRIAVTKAEAIVAKKILGEEDPPTSTNAQNGHLSPTEKAREGYRQKHGHYPGEGPGKKTPAQEKGGQVASEALPGRYTADIQKAKAPAGRLPLDIDEEEKDPEDWKDT